MEDNNQASPSKPGNTIPIDVTDHMLNTSACQHGQYIEGHRTDSDCTDEHTNLLQESQLNAENVSSVCLHENTNEMAFKNYNSNLNDKRALNPRIGFSQKGINTNPLDNSHGCVSQDTSSVVYMTPDVISIRTGDSSNIDVNETDIKNKLKDSTKQHIANKCKLWSHYVICCIIVLLINGLLCYFKDKRDNTIIESSSEFAFVNLKINFDLLKKNNKSGKIPWKPLNTSFVKLDEHGTVIHMLKSGSFSFSVALNFDNRPYKSQYPVFVCILNSRNEKEVRCNPGVLHARTQRSVFVTADLHLMTDDTIWVSVKGLMRVYERSDANCMTIRKFD